MLKYLEQIREGFQKSQSHQARKNTWKCEEHLGISCFYIIAFKDGAKGNLCQLMKEEESEQRVTAEERGKATGLLRALNKKIEAKYKW